MNCAAAVQDARHQATVLQRRASDTQVARNLQRLRPDFARIRGKIYLAITDQIEQASRA